LAYYAGFCKFVGFLFFAGVLLFVGVFSVFLVVFGVFLVFWRQNWRILCGFGGNLGEFRKLHVVWGWYNILLRCIRVFFGVF